MFKTLKIGVFALTLLMHAIELRANEDFYKLCEKVFKIAMTSKKIQSFINTNCPGSENLIDIIGDYTSSASIEIKGGSSSEYRSYSDEYFDDDFGLQGPENLPNYQFKRNQNGVRDYLLRKGHSYKVNAEFSNIEIDKGLFRQNLVGLNPTNPSRKHFQVDIKAEVVTVLCNQLYDSIKATQDISYSGNKNLSVRLNSEEFKEKFCFLWREDKGNLAKQTLIALDRSVQRGNQPELKLICILMMELIFKTTFFDYNKSTNSCKFKQERYNEFMAMSGDLLNCIEEHYKEYFIRYSIGKKHKEQIPINFDCIVYTQN